MEETLSGTCNLIYHPSHLIRKLVNVSLLYPADCKYPDEQRAKPKSYLGAILVILTREKYFAGTDNRAFLRAVSFPVELVLTKIRITELASAGSVEVLERDARIKHHVSKCESNMVACRGGKAGQIAKHRRYSSSTATVGTRRLLRESVAV